MRLEVFCEDRLGLTRELLDLLVLRGIDLRGIDIDPIGRIYLNFAELEFASFSSLMAEIRRIAGVTDVRTVPWMPSEREHLALSALLVAMPEPVLSLDTKGKVELANPASCQLFAQSPERLRNHPVAQLITDFNVQRWLESSPLESHSEHVVVNGQNFVLEITPVYLEGEHGERVLTGAVAMLRSTVRMGRQLQTMTTQDTSAFSQILAVGPKMRHVVEQARKLAMLSAPLLIVGDTGTGKDLLAHACHLASPRASKPYLALNCGSIPEDAVESELFGDAIQGKKGSLSRRTAVRSCWMKSAKCRRGCRPSCCVFSMTAPSGASGKITRFTSMCGSSARRRKIWWSWCRRDYSARISTTASTCSPSTCRRCATVRRISFR
jgi:transcriptional regulator of aroF, aroG, tyrA and aromatic amino acid transport